MSKRTGTGGQETVSPAKRRRNTTRHEVFMVHSVSRHINSHFKLTLHGQHLFVMTCRWSKMNHRWYTHAGYIALKIQHTASLAVRTTECVSKTLICWPLFNHRTQYLVEGAQVFTNCLQHLSSWFLDHVYVLTLQNWSDEIPPITYMFGVLNVTCRFISAQQQLCLQSSFASKDYPSDHFKSCVNNAFAIWLRMQNQLCMQLCSVVTLAFLAKGCQISISNVNCQWIFDSKFYAQSKGPLNDSLGS